MKAIVKRYNVRLVDDYPCSKVKFDFAWGNFAFFFLILASAQSDAAWETESWLDVYRYQWRAMALI